MNENCKIENCKLIFVIKLPKNDDKYTWTVHAIEKMRYYRLSESLVKRVIRFPKRTEKAIAPKTIGAMQPKGTTKNPREVWVMYRPVAERPSAEIALLLKTVTGSSLPKASSISGAGQSMSALGRQKVKIISAWIYPGVTKPGDPIPVPEDMLED